MRRANGTSKTVNANAQPHSWHGLYAMTPLALVVMILICGGALLVFTNLQVTGTENSVYALLQLTSGYPATASASQIQQLMTGDLNRYQTIADAIGWGVQIVLWTVTLSPESALVLVNLKHNDQAQAFLARNAAVLGKVRLALLVLLIGADILTDFIYAIQGHTVMVMDGWHPSIPSSAAAGVILVGLLYPAVIIFVNVFAAKYLFAFVEALVSKLVEAVAA